MMTKKAVEAANLRTIGGDTIATVFTRNAKKRCDSTFLTFEDASGRVCEYSYGEMEARANRVANLLRTLGIGKGDTFHVHLPNCPEFYECWFAGAKLGAIMVPTNPLSAADELSYILNHAKCQVSVTQPSLAAPVAKAQQRCPNLRHTLLARTERAQSEALLYEKELADRSDVLNDAPQVGPLDVSGILYTSGTTGKPKGVLVTNASYVHAGEVVAQHIRLRPDDRMMIVLPLFHGNAQYYSTMSALVTGASLALTESFSASRWSQQVAVHNATVASLFAAPIRMILEQPKNTRDNQNELRVVLFAQSVTKEQLEKFERRFGCQLLQLYGMTETVAPPTLNPLYGERRNMTIGRPMLWSQVRVVDNEGHDVPQGQVGEFIVRGDPGWTMMAGYFKDPEATSRTLRNGWLYTGDNVRSDEEGYIMFVDRGKDMIKRAGENISASEVESVINEHPAVFDSAVIGVPDKMRDEVVKALVIIKQGMTLTEEEVISSCKDRLAKFKVPGIVEFVDNFPRTSVGKIQKHLLQ